MVFGKNGRGEGNKEQYVSARIRSAVKSGSRVKEDGRWIHELFLEAVVTTSALHQSSLAILGKTRRLKRALVAIRCTPTNRLDIKVNKL